MNSYTIFYEYSYLGYVGAVLLAFILAFLIAILLWRKRFLKIVFVSSIFFGLVLCGLVYVVFSVLRVGWDAQVAVLQIDGGVVEDDFLVVNIQTDAAAPLTLWYVENGEGREIKPTHSLQARNSHSFLIEGYTEEGEIYPMVDGTRYGINFRPLAIY